MGEYLIGRLVFSDCIVKNCSRAIGIWARDGGEIADAYVRRVIGNTKQYADCPDRKFTPSRVGKGRTYIYYLVRGGRMKVLYQEK